MTNQKNQSIHASYLGNSNHWIVSLLINLVLSVILFIFCMSPTTLFAVDCNKEATSGAAVSCLQERIRSLSEQLERIHEQQVRQGSQVNWYRPLFLNAETDGRGHFIARHHFGNKADHVYGLLVAVQHKGGGWNTLDTSNTYNNTFFWNKERVEGWIMRKDDAFANRPVRIMVFFRE